MKFIHSLLKSSQVPSTTYSLSPCTGDRKWIYARPGKCPAFSWPHQQYVAVVPCRSQFHLTIATIGLTTHARTGIITGTPCMGCTARGFQRWLVGGGQPLQLTDSRRTWYRMLSWFITGAANTRRDPASSRPSLYEASAASGSRCIVEFLARPVSSFRGLQSVGLWCGNVRACLSLVCIERDTSWQRRVSACF